MILGGYRNKKTGDIYCAIAVADEFYARGRGHIVVFHPKNNDGEIFVCQESKFMDNFNLLIAFTIPTRLSITANASGDS
jgi:hypothetical protein